MPGPNTISSASSMAARTSGSVATSAGFKPTRRVRLRARGICDSPSTMVPSVNSAHNTTSWATDGSTRPRMFSTLLVSFTALSRSPVTPARLAMNRLPNAWPSSAPPWKRYSNSWVISGSDSASATRQSRMSPGGRMPSSRRSRPELPPSSNTVTTAVRLLVNSFSPRSSVESPVPPPMTTMRGPRRRWRCWARTSTSWCWPGGRRAPAMARTVPCRPANTASNPPPMNATPSQLGDSAPRLQVSTAPARRNIENSIQPSGRTLTMSRTPADSNKMPAAISTTHRFTPSPGASHWARRRSLVGTGLLLPDVAMPHRNAVAAAREVLRQFIRQDHRAVFASRTPQRHCQMRLALFHVVRQEIIHQRGQMAHKLLRRRRAEHKTADLRAAAGQGTQRFVVVRVRQEPHIEHEIGVERDAILISERDHGDGQGGRVRSPHERVHDGVPQFSHAQCRRIDDLTRFPFHRLQPVPLRADAIHDAAGLGQRVLPAGFLEAADQHVIGGIEKQNDIVQAHRLEMAQRSEEIVEELTPAHVDGQGSASYAPLGLQTEFDELWQQRRGQVVHAEEAEVLKHLHRVRLSGAG